MLQKASFLLDQKVTPETKYGGNLMPENLIFLVWQC